MYSATVQLYAHYGICGKQHAYTQTALAYIGSGTSVGLSLVADLNPGLPMPDVRC
jgi:hypothetical protein